MTLDEFIYALSNEGQEEPLAESAIYFSVIDLENNCSINQYEASLALEFFFEIPPAEQMPILE